MELLTPRGRGGVAVLHISDSDRATLFETLRAPGGNDLSTRAGDAPRRAVWQLPGGIEDDVLVVDRGVLGVEVHAHGSIALLDAVEAAFGPLVETAGNIAEALLRHALSREQMLLAMEQRKLDFDEWLRRLASLPRAEALQQVRSALERSRAAMALARPARVVLVGRQNAGKSTLFNRLVFCERALAGPHAGLTRDPVTEQTALSGYPYQFVDTAGEAADAVGIDANAIERARFERRYADVVLLVVDRSSAPSQLELEIATRGAMLVASKADLFAAEWPDSLRPVASFSALDPASAPKIRAVLGEALRAWRGLPPAGPVGGPAALDQRQLEALSLLASGSSSTSA